MFNAELAKTRTGDLGLTQEALAQTPLLTFTDGSSSVTFDMGMRLSNKECEVLLNLLTIIRIYRWTEMMEDDERFDKCYTLINLVHRLREATHETE